MVCAILCTKMNARFTRVWSAHVVRSGPDDLCQGGYSETHCPLPTSHTRDGVTPRRHLALLVFRRWVGGEIGFFSLESGGLRPPQGKVLFSVGVPGDSEPGPKPFTSRPSRPSIIRITIF